MPSVKARSAVITPLIAKVVNRLGAHPAIGLLVIALWGYEYWPALLWRIRQGVHQLEQLIAGPGSRRLVGPHSTVANKCASESPGIWSYRCSSGQSQWPLFVEHQKHCRLRLQWDHLDVWQEMALQPGALLSLVHGLEVVGPTRSERFPEQYGGPSGMQGRTMDALIRRVEQALLKMPHLQAFSWSGDIGCSPPRAVLWSLAFCNKLTRLSLAFRFRGSGSIEPPASASEAFVTFALMCPSALTHLRLTCIIDAGAGPAADGRQDFAELVNFALRRWPKLQVLDLQMHSARDVSSTVWLPDVFANYKGDHLREVRLLNVSLPTTSVNDLINRNPDLSRVQSLFTGKTIADVRASIQEDYGAVLQSDGELGIGGKYPWNFRNALARVKWTQRTAIDGRRIRKERPFK